MTNSKNTKRALLGSVLAVVVCVVMLIGSTFAWFTDSVTSSGNKIQAGQLGIAASYQDVDMSAGTVSYTIPGFDRVADGTVKFLENATQIDQNQPIIPEDFWEPGAVGAKLITVKNDGNLAAKIKLQFVVADSGLQDALWFDFIRVENNAVTGTFQEREMSTLATFADKLEIPLLKGESTSFILLYGMKEEAGNEYQNASFSADVTILAAQYTSEQDSFDDQYDKNAEYPVYVATEEQLKDALTSAKDGDVIALTDNMELNNSLRTLNKNITLDAQGNTISGVPMYITGDKQVTVKNAVFSNAEKNQESCVYIQNLSGKYVFENCKFNNTKWDGIQMTGDLSGSELVVNNCTFSSAEQRYIHVEALNDGNPNLNTDVKVTITNNTFGQNPKNDAIGLYYIAVDGITAYNNTFASEQPSIYICSNSTAPSISQADAIKMFTAKK